MFVATTPFDGASLASAAVDQAKSFLQLIQHRSPGLRTKGMLVTKHKRPLAHERALPKVRMAVPAIPAAPPLFYQPALVDLIWPPVSIPPTTLEAMAFPEIGQPSYPPGSPLIQPPHIIVPPFQTPTTTPVVPPISAVPEPGTWLTMLLGFGFIGWQLRRRRAEGKPLRLS